MRSSTAAVALVTVALALTACGSSSSGHSVVAASAAARVPTAPAAAESSAGDTAGKGDGYGAAATAPTAVAAAGVLKIAAFRYDPTPITVAAGQVVSVTNSDSADHTVTSDQNGLFLGDDIAQGKTITFRAPTRPGTYTFHCEYHPSMHGTLTVK
jgi:plastocyanin